MSVQLGEVAAYQREDFGTSFRPAVRAEVSGLHCGSSLLDGIRIFSIYNPAHTSA